MKWKAKMAAAFVGIALLAGAGGVFAGINLQEVPVSGDGVGFSSAETADVGIEKIEKVYELIQENYMEEIDEEKLINGALSGMVEELNDPHSVYMEEQSAEHFNQSLESSFEGIGAEVSMVDGVVTIVSPFRDSPAEKAGIQPNDRVLEVDGESTEGATLQETVAKIRGEKGTTVTLTIQRQGASTPFHVEVVRDEIPVETVYSKMFTEDGQKIGYIEITSFSEDTASEFEEQLKTLEEDGMEGLIIDVRGNPGGFLNSVEDIGDLVIPGGENIVQIQDPDGNVVQSVSTLKEKKPYPIVGVIDRGSVSASEILAAALKEAGNYDLVGETTYGKGTVQQALDLGDGSELKLSMFKWLTPDGHWINEEGVEPTVEVMQPDYFYSPVLSLEEEETLSEGSYGEQVAVAQNILEGLGYSPGQNEGLFDVQTRQAVEDFQAKTDGLAVTGAIDYETATSLNQALLDLIRSEENDRQLKEALNLIQEQLS
ncbi:S41 family peptidase [Aliibacillus thermotolerans]|uniref:S41 family peptidase n=1 Tax=Aliibacillus thermotolerans TaxID=1834418 RepID=A0ABW0U4C8_9BACI|nr:S41 family peptidase [Aliibacillus thermotolerans]MDA3128694.1 PDZ domain-containing protein [Aliibacillus thermotolerans]